MQNAATFCPQCGTPVYQSVATPVAHLQTPANLQLPPASQGTNVAQPMFSYLPAGAPPWPSTIPQERPSSRPSPQVTTTETKAKVERYKPSIRGAMLIAFLVVLTPVLGALFTLGTLYAQGQLGTTNPVGQPAPTSRTPATIVTATPSAQTDQLPTPTAFRQTSNVDVNVSFKYPTDWMADAPQKSTDVTSLSVHPSQQLGIIFIVRRFSQSTSSSIQSPDQINQDLVSRLGTNVKDIQAVPAPADQPLVGGVKWVEQDGILVDSNGSKLHFATLSVQHNKRYYNIIASMPDLYYNEALHKYINPILGSLRFLS